jgi:uronate dehydrogenase
MARRRLRERVILEDLTKWNRLLFTGAAGRLATALRPMLAQCATTVRVTDLRSITSLATHEEQISCDLTDESAVGNAVDGCDAIVHFGGIPTEASFDDILQANIRGTYNIYQAARTHSVKRVVLASSNHVIGFHEQGVMLDARSERRPDTLYGLSKSFSEDLARYYFDKCGIESICLRIGSCTPAPENRRALSTWLSYRDLQTLVLRCLRAPSAGHTIVYGVSANAASWWDNKHAAHLGYSPQDEASDFLQLPELSSSAAEDEPAIKYQGGPFVMLEPPQNR